MLDALCDIDGDENDTAETVEYPIDQYWQRALTAAAIIAVDDGRLIGGAIVRAPHGVARDRWHHYLQMLLPDRSPTARLPANITDQSLLGGLDLASTLATGRVVAERGLLANCHLGLVTIPMAERLPTSTAAKLTQVIDSRMVNCERDGVKHQHEAIFRTVLFDESDAAEAGDAASGVSVSAALADRLAFHLDLTGIPCRWLSTHDNLPTPDGLPTLNVDDVAAARSRVAAVEVGLDKIETLVASACYFGISSLRAPLLALNVAKIIAALNNHESLTDEDVTLAAEYVLSPRARIMPANRTEQPNDKNAEDAPQSDNRDAPPEPPTPPENQPPSAPTPDATEDSSQDKSEDSPDTADTPDPPKTSTEDQQALEDVVLAAIASQIPAKLRQQLIAQRVQAQQSVASSTQGRAGNLQRSTTRGRVVGTVANEGSRGNTAMLNILATLRAAAPWQRIRRHQALQANAAKPSTSANSIFIRREDFRLNRYQQRSKTTTIFVVDASGSSALNRLAEAKGAIELLLADCYIRRDQVAVIAFRGKTAEILLNPTRSLVRAKRSLAALPGGGGTPLACGIDAAREMAEVARRAGDTVMMVLLTDGTANVNRLGQGGRAAAQLDAINAAKALSQIKIKSLMIDTSPNKNPLASTLATQMNAIYLALPYADASAMATAVKAANVGNATTLNR